MPLFPPAVELALLGMTAPVPDNKGTPERWKKTNGGQPLPGDMVAAWHNGAEEGSLKIWSIENKHGDEAAFVVGTVNPEEKEEDKKIAVVQIALDQPGLTVKVTPEKGPELFEKPIDPLLKSPKPLHIYSHLLGNTVDLTQATHNTSVYVHTGSTEVKYSPFSGPGELSINKEQLAYSVDGKPRIPNIRVYATANQLVQTHISEGANIVILFADKRIEYGKVFTEPGDAKKNLDIDPEKMVKPNLTMVITNDEGKVLTEVLVLKQGSLADEYEAVKKSLEKPGMEQRKLQDINPADPLPVPQTPTKPGLNIAVKRSAGGLP